MLRKVVALVCVSCAVGCGGSSESELKGSGGSKNDASTGGQAGAASGGEAGTSSGGSSGSVGVGGAAGSGGAPSCALAVEPPGTSELSVTSSGEARSARVVVPTSYDGTKLVPLILVFHGYLEDDQKIENTTKMTPVAEANGFIAVYPQGIGNSWNAGSCCGSGSSTQRPDVQFVSDLLDALEQKLCIDPKRIYAAGFSNGGMFSKSTGLRAFPTHRCDWTGLRAASGQGMQPHEAAPGDRVSRHR